jgi:uncharacterized protein YjiS (DUF1127 family)
MLQYLYIKLKNIFKAIQANQEKRAHYWMLQKLSDRELHDLGIGRGQIREVIYGDASGISRC